MTEKNQTCPCGSGRRFAECCEPIINGTRESETAEELLRARYSAFVMGAIDFIVASTHPSTRKDIDLAFVREWSETSTWHGLEILEAKAVSDNKTYVSFECRFTQKGADQAHREKSLFEREDGQWRFVTGDELKSFKRANEMREKKCAECYGWMTETYLSLEAYKNVIDAADKLIELAGGNNQLLVKAYNNKGLALQQSAEKKDQKKLAAAEVVFRQGLAVTGAPPILHYNLGVALLQLNRDDEGVVEIRQYLKLQPRGGYSETARKLVENPRRARENYAPDFGFTSLQGEYITLDDLKGKVVVLDFWGTWCPPCVESVPELRNLNKRYSKEQPFVLIGISSDGDEQAWREFTEKNRMVWPQYRDKDHKILAAFNIHAFPTYIIIDHEGIVRFQSVGFSWQRAASLDNAIQKYVKAVARSQDAR